jgi:hypothetical protein
MLKESKTGEKKFRSSDHRNESDKLMRDGKIIRKRNEEKEKIKKELYNCL